MNLAYFKYSKVLKKFGGPIERIFVGRISRFGEDFFEAYTFLDQQILKVKKETGSIYGTCDGTGTHRTKSGAVFRAISEAIERWAWASVVHDSSNGRLGLNLDSTTTGFAAYPGLLKASPRRFAFLEAVERWSLKHWWQGQLAHQPLLLDEGADGIQIVTPIGGSGVAILWSNSPAGRAYGFAAGGNLFEAVVRAKVELGRNLEVLNRKDDVSSRDLTVSRNELRLRHFASPEGIDAFECRLRLSNLSVMQKPELVVDSYVTGPWTKYTHIWRCLFDPSGHVDPGTVDYFFF